MVEPVFKDINAEDSDNGITEIESLCMQCHENGTTRMMLTRIPFFKEVIISSFQCEQCGLNDNEIQPASEIQKKGVKYTLKVNGLKDLSRQVVRQGSAMFRIEELDFEAPPFTSKGALTTVEGMIQTAMEGLEQQQAVRKIMEPALAEKIDAVIKLLDKYKNGENPFTLMLNDISGNSFVENPFAPEKDEALTVTQYVRSKEESERLGISQEMEEQERENEKEMDKELGSSDEVMEFPGVCQECGSPANTKMKMLQIPHFKEVVIMATSCDVCGDKSSEVKAGGGIEEQGTKIVLKITDSTDLSRDVLTSETCHVTIPELDMELSHSSDAGRFTTLEGLLENIKTGIGRINPFAFGDSSNKKTKICEITEQVQEIIDGKRFVTIVFDDPVGNSHVQNLYAPDPDPNLTITKYDRTPEMEDDLGIADMKIENYQNEAEEEDAEER